MISPLFSQNLEDSRYPVPGKDSCENDGEASNTNDVTTTPKKNFFIKLHLKFYKLFQRSKKLPLLKPFTRKKEARF